MTTCHNNAIIHKGTFDSLTSDMSGEACHWHPNNSYSSLPNKLPMGFNKESCLPTKYLTTSQQFQTRTFSLENKRVKLRITH